MVLEKGADESEKITFPARYFDKIGLLNTLLFRLWLDEKNNNSAELKPGKEVALRVEIQVTQLFPALRA